MTGRPSESRTVDLAILSEGLSVQEASQRLTIVVLGLPGHAGIRRAIEAVIRPRIYVQLDWNPGAAQSIRIRSDFLQGRDRDRRPKCRLAASPTHPPRARPPHKARRPAEPGSSPSSERQPK